MLELEVVGLMAETLSTQAGIVDRPASKAVVKAEVLVSEEEPPLTLSKSQNTVAEVMAPLAMMTEDRSVAEVNRVRMDFIVIQMGWVKTERGRQFQ